MGSIATLPERGEQEGEQNHQLMMNIFRNVTQNEVNMKTNNKLGLSWAKLSTAGVELG